MPAATSIRRSALAAWAACRFRAQSRLPAGRRFAIVSLRPPMSDGRCSQGGAKFPTGGKGPRFQKRFKPASAFLFEPGNPGLEKKGQQIRCNSEADG